ncbi:hypothetical protein D1007_07700 [Hordeum vulgare]|nr:hypothetical protein D1007_42939 [Hordeum vulgare]KAE8814986.1 hypothetical protein D1007_07700 [Hordeum vulgare]
MEPPETTTTLTRTDDARTFEFTIKIFPSKAKLGDGSLRGIEGDTIVKWEVELSESDPQELQSMKEKAVRNVVAKIGESIFWGLEQEVALLWFDNWKGEHVRIEDGEEMVDEIDRQNGWTTKQTTFRAELVDLKSDSKVGYVPSKLAAQMVDDDWASERQIMPMCTGEVTVLHEGADADAQEGSDGVARVLSIDWNSVELNEPTDLVIAPVDDTEMAKFFGIPVPDEDKEENDETTNPLTDAQRDICEDVDGQLMEDAADDVDDAHDDELVNVYDKENPVIAVGKLFPNMDEFRMCFKTYAIKHEFDAKIKWTDIKSFMQDAEVLMEVSSLASADVVQAEPILEVVLPNPVFPQDVVPTKPILEVLLPTELDDNPADAVMKTKSLSELGIVVKRSTDKKKKKKKVK